MFSYDTVTDAVSGLKSRGYTVDFNLEQNCIKCERPALALKPSDFHITEVYRFEGESDPADEAVVYAIESKTGEKGVLVNGFGPSSDSLEDAMIEKLKIDR